MSGLSPQAGSAARAELMKYTGRGVNKKNIMKDKSHQEKSGDSWRRARSNAGASPTNRSPARKRDGKSPPRTSRGKSPPRATETEMEKIREEEEGSDQGETREGASDFLFTRSSPLNSCPASLTKTTFAAPCALLLFRICRGLGRRRGATAHLDRRNVVRAGSECDTAPGVSIPLPRTSLLINGSTNSSVALAPCPVPRV